MGKQTGVSWTDATWNPWQGCTKTRYEGCRHCYMFREKRRYGQDPGVVVRSHQRTFVLPRRLPVNAKVFVCSWSDFFHEAADDWRPEAWAIMRERPDLTYIIPTKRPDRVPGLLPWGNGRPWSNVWGLVSASTQLEVDELVTQLLLLPFAVRGVSLEPLLGAIDLPLEWLAPFKDTDPMLNRTPRLDWVICAGESGGPPERALVCRSRHPVTNELSIGPKPEALARVRSLRDQCQAAGVPFHFKGWGGPKPTSGGRLLDGREWLEFPR